jgi:hypothetical protein
MSGRLFAVELVVERGRSASQLVDIWVGSPFAMMKDIHEGWRSVEVGAGSLGSVLCSTEAGQESRMARRVSMEVCSAVLCPCLSPLGSIAMMS